MADQFLPPNYQQELFRQYQNCRQGTRTVNEYMEEFDRLANHNDLKEIEDQWESNTQISFFCMLFTISTINMKIPCKLINEMKSVKHLSNSPQPPPPRNYSWAFNYFQWYVSIINFNLLQEKSTRKKYILDKIFRLTYLCVITICN